MEKHGLTMGQVAEWAIGRGFSRRDGDMLAISFGGAEVILTPMTRNLRVTLRRGEQETLLASVPPARLFIDEDGVLQGAGLSNSFLMRFCRSADDVPPWYPEPAAVKVRALLEDLHGGESPAP